MARCTESPVWCPGTLHTSFGLSSVQELHVVSGVCSKLEAVDSADQGVGCDAVGSWHGVLSRPFGVREPCTHRLGRADQGVGCDAVGSWHGLPSRPFGVREPCTHRSGPYVETSAGLPADGT